MHRTKTGRCLECTQQQWRSRTKGETAVWPEMLDYKQRVPAWKPPHAVAGVTLARLMAGR